MEERLATTGRADAAQPPRDGFLQKLPGEAPGDMLSVMDVLADTEVAPGIASVDPVELEVVGSAINSPVCDAGQYGFSIAFLEVLPTVEQMQSPSSFVRRWLLKVTTGRL